MGSWERISFNSNFADGIRQHRASCLLHTPPPEAAQDGAPLQLPARPLQRAPHHADAPRWGPGSSRAPAAGTRHTHHTCANHQTTARASGSLSSARRQLAAAPGSLALAVAALHALTARARSGDGGGIGLVG
jgi:hypothetical protein